MRGATKLDRACGHPSPAHSRRYHLGMVVMKTEQRKQRVRLKRDGKEEMRRGEASTSGKVSMRRADDGERNMGTTEWGRERRKRRERGGASETNEAAPCSRQDVRERFSIRPGPQHMIARAGGRAGDRTARAFDVLLLSSSSALAEALGDQTGVKEPQDIGEVVGVSWGCVGQPDDAIRGEVGGAQERKDVVGKPGHDLGDAGLCAGLGREGRAGVDVDDKVVSLVEYGDAEEGVAPSCKGNVVHCPAGVKDRERFDHGLPCDPVEVKGRKPSTSSYVPDACTASIHSEDVEHEAVAGDVDKGAAEGVLHKAVGRRKRIMDGEADDHKRSSIESS
eukprot:768291-Hanusia_phi.AAC.2